MPSSTVTKPSSTQVAGGGHELREISVSQIVVSQNNPRKQFDEQELERLAHAVRERGFNHPILVKIIDEQDCYELIDGERRWRAAQHAEVELIPALVKTRQSIPGDDLLDAMLANGLGVHLDVVEEALGYQALISDAGYTRKGIAEAFKIPQARVRERLLILELPEKLRQQVAAGIVPLMAVKTLSTLAKIHGVLAEVAVKRVLDGPFEEWDEPRTWEEMVADPISVVIGDYEVQRADLPEDVFVAGCAYPVSLFELDDQAVERLASLCELMDLDVGQFQVCFRGGLVDQALALGAAHQSANKTEAIIVGTDIAGQLASDYITECLKQVRQQAAAESEDTEPSGDVGSPAATGGEDPDSDGGEGDSPRPPSQEQIEAGRERAIEEDRALRDRTIAANQRLGAALVKHLGKVKVDDRVLKILTSAPISSDLAKIASRGARLAFPGWAELSTFKNGSTKAEYLDYAACEAKAREYLAGASAAAEIAGRLIALLAAARWAKQEWVVSNAQRSDYTLRFASYFNDRGVPWSGDVEDLLDAILIEKLPPEVSDPIREAKEHREAVRAEEERRERERDAVVAAFIEQAASLTRDERHAEIQRLRGEYGFMAVTQNQATQLMKLPEPGGAEDAEQAKPDDEAVAEVEVALAA